MILGYPWLCSFNPQIDWPSNMLIGPQVKMATPLHAKYPDLHNHLRKRHTVIPTLTKADEIDLVARTTTLEKALAPEEPSTLTTFPLELVLVAQKATTNMTKEELKALIFKAKQPMPPTPTSEEPKEKTSEELILKAYHDFLDIFAKPVIGQLPPHWEWDLKV